MTENSVRFKLAITATMKMTVFWTVTCVTWYKYTDVSKQPAAPLIRGKIFYPDSEGSGFF
jgi:hypothetical protein